MCGRYSLRASPDELLEHFDLLTAPAWEPRYNIAPTQESGVVRRGSTGRREWALLQWGLIPHDTPDAATGARLINARSETVQTKPSFRWAFAHSRCLVPADGFYEWRRLPGGRRQPVHFRTTSGSLFAFAGLWDRWADRSGREVETFTILTTSPNAAVEPVHDRMPVLLPPEAYDLWLQPDATAGELLDVARPYPAAEMVGVEVNPVVNRTAVDGPECLEPPPAPPTPPQTELDLFG